MGLWLWSVNVCLSVTSSVKWVDLDQMVYVRGWHTFSVKGQIVNMSGLRAILSLLQLLHSAIVVRKQPQKIHK